MTCVDAWELSYVVSSVHTVWLRSTEYLLSYHMMCELVYNEEAGIYSQPGQMHDF